MPRRLGSALLVGAGVFCLILALLVLTVAKPRLLKAPTSNAVSTTSLGTAKVLDGATRTYSEQTLRLDRILRNATDGNSDTAVFSEQLRLYPITPDGKVLLKDGSTADSPFVDGEFVGSRLDDFVVAFDRKTGQGRPDVPEDTYGTTGYTVKLPFGTEKQIGGKPASYDFFDQTSGQAFPITYTGTETVDGLEVYRFEGAIANMVIDQQFGVLEGTKTAYSNKGRVVLVEPVTGSIVSIVTQPSSSIVNADGSTTLALAFTTPLTPTPDTIAERVADAKDSKSKARLISFTLPLVLGILGLVLLFAGAAAQLSRGRTGDGEAVDGYDRDGYDRDAVVGDGYDRDAVVGDGYDRDAVEHDGYTGDRAAAGVDSSGQPPAGRVDLEKPGVTTALGLDDDDPDPTSRRLS